MFEYLIVKVPVIISTFPEMKKLVEDNNIKCLEQSIEEAIQLNQYELQKNLQKVKEVYNWEEQEKVFLEVYRAVLQ